MNRNLQAAEDMKGEYVDNSSLKADRSWGLLGQCLCILLESTILDAGSITPDLAWKKLGSIIDKQHGCVFVSSLKNVSKSHISDSQYAAVLKIIDPMHSAKLVSDIVLGFISRVKVATAKMGLWARQRFGFSIEVICRWIQLVLLGIGCLLLLYS